MQKEWEKWVRSTYSHIHWNAYIFLNKQWEKILKRIIFASLCKFYYKSLIFAWFRLSHISNPKIVYNRNFQLNFQQML